MKRFLSFALMCLTFAFAIANSKPIKIKVKTPGTLSRLTEAYQPKNVTSLTISGTLNDADIKSLKRFVEYAQDSAQVKKGGIEVLDLSQTILDDYNSGVALNSLLKNAQSIKQVALGDIFYLACATFYNMPNLEQVDFKGFIGHMDGYMFAELPHLQSITFHKSILCTGVQNLLETAPCSIR